MCKALLSSLISKVTLKPHIISKSGYKSCIKFSFLLIQILFSYPLRYVNPSHQVTYVNCPTLSVSLYRNCRMYSPFNQSSVGGFPCHRNGNSKRNRLSDCWGRQQTRQTAAFHHFHANVQIPPFTVYSGLFPCHMWNSKLTTRRE